MDAPKPHDANKCPHCRVLQARLQQLEGELDLKSRQFSRAVAQLKTNHRAKARAEQLDERFVEQCIRAKTESEIELARQSRLFAAKVEKIKAEAQNKNNELAHEVNKLRRQLTERTEACQKQIAEVTRNAGHDAARYEQIITKLKTESSQKAEAAVAQTRQEYVSLIDKVKHLEQQNIRLRNEFQKHLSRLTGELKQKSQAYEQTIARLKQQYEQTITGLNSRTDRVMQEKDERIVSIKEQLARVGDKITASAREKSRAEQLNQRLLEQCRMAKAGADVEIELRSREFTENAARLRSQATSKLQALADQNTKLKAQAQQTVTRLRDYADALNRANVRIKSLERAMAEMRGSTISSPQF
jgi:DNA repair exonuclease SbcCD ATPase subunit